MTDHPILFLAGPTEVDEELRRIMAMPLVGHRSAEFKACTIRVADKLRVLYRTEQHAFFENAPATALMEAGIRNLVGTRVLHLSCGSFGDRWKKISAACGREVGVVEAPWGTGNTPAALRQALLRDAPYEAVCITHNETSTGVINPLGELAAVVREVAPDTLILADVVTSLAGAELRFDEWGLDLAFAGTQKCLALPPGLCTFALSQRAIEKSAHMPGRGFLFDFAATPERFKKGEPPATPCIPLAFALDRQLDRIAAEGLEARWRRHTAMRDTTIAWAERHGFTPLVADAAFRSPTVSSLRNGKEDGGKIVARAKAAGFTLGRGYGDLKDTTFRVGHMGDHDLARLTKLLAAVAL